MWMFLREAEERSLCVTGGTWFRVLLQYATAWLLATFPILGTSSSFQVFRSPRDMILEAVSETC